MDLKRIFQSLVRVSLHRLYRSRTLENTDFKGYLNDRWKGLASIDYTEYAVVTFTIKLGSQSRQIGFKMDISSDKYDNITALQTEITSVVMNAWRLLENKKRRTDCGIRKP